MKKHHPNVMPSGASSSYSVESSISSISESCSSVTSCPSISTNKGNMNLVSSMKASLSPRKKGAPPALNIPTIKETHDASALHKNKATVALKIPIGASLSDPSRRLSFRLGSDAEESNNSSSQRTTPSFSTGNSVFDFEYSFAQSDSSCTTPSPKVLSGANSGMTPGAVFLAIPRDPFQVTFGPITNSHSSDKLASGSIPTPPISSTVPAKTRIHISRSCSMLTKGVFGGGKGLRSKERSQEKIRRCSSQTEKDGELSIKSSANPSRKSSDTDAASSDSSIFARLMQRWHTYQNGSSAGSVPAHALFLRYNLNNKKNTKKSSRSNSETDAVEKTVKQRLRHLVRRNTESVLKEKRVPKNGRSPRPSPRSSNAASNRPTAEEARSWAESFDNLLASTYGLALFRAFLKLEYNEENLAFYLACEKFKRLDPSSHRKIHSKAQKIYDEFIRVEAPREVNMDSLTRATTVTNLANPNRHCFDHAQRRIRHVLEKDVYPRFLHFDLYTRLLQDTSSVAVPINVNCTVSHSNGSNTTVKS
ncbi:regulator of G-protein signaling rgs-7-like [Paramacrobiotus metropolitanus]|uniref:regulator of G-protein signaling rgs-7-like n=1 Tax=Paramacrobiotus metropolitanus TaxID=2943436 RepID=UPI002445EA10|nr:regulator of G-protein signaling rgs-7-like [Paramacrobiotus metropolitanus]